MEKKVYIVRGSEDGNLGVYTNVKLAHKHVVNVQPNVEKFRG